MTDPMDPAALFNCRTDHAEPDWSEFNALEISGCVNDSEDEDETCIVGGIDRAEAEFFTVYGRLKSDEFDVCLVDAITDADTLEEAERIAGILSERSGLPVNVLC